MARDFSAKTKEKALIKNLSDHDGVLTCNACKKKIVDIKNDLHYDHIKPAAKGGPNTLENCQILCFSCNEKKNAKLYQEFLNELKAERIINGEENWNQNVGKGSIDGNDSDEIIITKEVFDNKIGEFINKHGDISTKDFLYQGNDLPSQYYIKQYYGSLTKMKAAFGINVKKWDKDSIIKALQDFVKKNGGITYEDVACPKDNGLPSLTCITAHFKDEGYEKFSDIKKNLCNLSVKTNWTEELALNRGKEFVSKRKKLTQKDLTAENNLPSATVVTRLFGSLPEYQRRIGAPVKEKPVKKTKEEIRNVLHTYFKDEPFEVETTDQILSILDMSMSSLSRMYGSLSNFCSEENVNIRNAKKTYHNVRELDDVISKWMAEENEIPKYKELTKLGLPSVNAISRFYKDWHEPFEKYRYIHSERKRIDKN